MPRFNYLEMEYFEISVGKEENTGKEHFVLLPQCFLTIQLFTK